MEMPDPVPFLAVVLLAGAAIGVTAMLSPQNRVAFVYAQLVMMTGIYIGFAVMQMDAADLFRREEFSTLLIESVSALAFTLIGLAYLNSERPEMLGVLILLHGGVDLAHLLTDAAYAPGWYVYGCLIYDALVGVATIWLISRAKTA